MRMKTRFVKMIMTLIVFFIVCGALYGASVLCHQHSGEIEQITYRYPCIVVDVDNQGCQTRIEMLTHVALLPKGTD